MKARINFESQVVSLNALGGYMGAVTAAGQTMYWLAYAHPELVREWGFEFYPEEGGRGVNIDFDFKVSDSWAQAADEIAKIIKAGPRKSCDHRCDVHGELA